MIMDGKFPIFCGFLENIFPFYSFNTNNLENGKIG
jgi:hypothetical protein